MVRIASPLLLATSLALTLTACQKAQTFGNIDQARADDSENDDGNWLTYGHGYQEQRYSRLDQVNDGNVPGRCQLAENALQPGPALQRDLFRHEIARSS